MSAHPEEVGWIAWVCRAHARESDAVTSRVDGIFCQRPPRASCSLGNERSACLVKRLAEILDWTGKERDRTLLAVPRVEPGTRRTTSSLCFWSRKAAPLRCRSSAASLWVASPRLAIALGPRELDSVEKERDKCEAIGCAFFARWGLSWCCPFVGRWAGYKNLIYAWLERVPSACTNPAVLETTR